MTDKLSAILDRLNAAWRVPNVARKPETSFEFVPVIFANGEDDDTPGFVAAIQNEAVQFDDVIFKPGEGLEITGRMLRFCVGGITVAYHDGTMGQLFPAIAHGPQITVHSKLVGSTRSIHVESCNIDWGVR